MSHTCHAEGCHVEVEPRYLFCPRHWKMLPKSYQRAIWNAYVEGQEIRKDPTPEYLEVMQKAIDYVADKEGL